MKKRIKRLPSKKSISSDIKIKNFKIIEATQEDLNKRAQEIIDNPIPKELEEILQALANK